MGREKAMPTEPWRARLRWGNSRRGEGRRQCRLYRIRRGWVGEEYEGEGRMQCRLSVGGEVMWGKSWRGRENALQAASIHNFCCLDFDNTLFEKS